MGGKSRPPAPPDPNVVANAQTQSNLATARNEATINRYDQNTPWGNVSWTNNGDRWTQNTNLSPNQQQLLSQEEQNSLGLGQLAGDQINTVGSILGQNYNPRRFDMNAATGGQLDLSSALGDFRGDIEGRTRELMTRGLDQQFGRAEESLRSRLANQGINAGADAFGAELQSFNEGRGDAYANAELAARDFALGERGQHMGELLTQRGTNLSEALQGYQLDDRADFQQRTQPLNEIIGLMNGSQIGYQPVNPGQGANVNISPTDIAGIQQNAYGNRFGAWQQQQQGRNALLGSLANLGAAGMTAFSDPRLKRDVEYAHTDANGVPWWRYRYKWDADDAPKRLGVMADDVPHARIMTASGFWAVDYGRL